MAVRPMAQSGRILWGTPGAGVGKYFPLQWALPKQTKNFTARPNSQAKNLDSQRHGQIRRRLLHLDGFRRRCRKLYAGAFFLPKPADRDVVCHASAWDLDNSDDLRIKMCIQVRGVDFVTVHHELGHNFYQRAYKAQPFLFQNGANDGFHEAIGDAIALSITPQYLNKVGLLAKVPEGDDDIPDLLKQALDKVASCPSD